MQSASSQEEVEGYLRQSSEFLQLEVFSAGKKNKNVRWPLSQIFVDINHKIGYCPIGKVGNSTLKEMFIGFSNIDNKEMILSGGVHEVPDLYNTGLQLSDYPDDVVDGMISDPEFVFFAVLRNPVERCLSVYWEKFVKNRRTHGNVGHTAPVLSAVQRVPLNEVDVERGISFKDFVNYVISCNPDVLDTHWKPQERYLGGIVYNKLFALENLDEMYRFLEERTGLVINRKKTNSSRAGYASVVEGAYNVLPGDLEKYDNIEKRCFLNSDLLRKIERYYSVDCLLHKFAA